MLLCMTALVSCHPYQPYGPYDRYGGGYPGSGRPEGSDPIINNGNPSNPGICDDYLNRNKLVDGVNVFLSDYGTLYWYDAGADRCQKLCWADVSVRRVGYYIYIYRYISGEMREFKVYDSREDFSVRLNVLACNTASPDYLIPRVVVVHSTVTYVEVYMLLENGDDETFKM